MSAATARRGAVLALVAVVLLANPIYVPHLVDEDESQSGTSYGAFPVDPGNASDQRRIERAVGDDDVVDVAALADANEQAVYGDEYAAPEAAAAALERAIETGNASTSDADAAFTLRRVAAVHEFALADADARTYYRIDAGPAGNATGDEAAAATVTAERASRGAVADFLVHRDAVLYASLPESQRAAVEEAIAAGDRGYLPEDSEALWGLTDDIVVRDDTYYVVEPVAAVDDFGPSTRRLASLLLSGLGALAAVAALVLTARSYRTARAE
jgi:hypothetical protein